MVKKYIFKLAKKGYGLLGKSDKSVGTLTVKPSGKKRNRSIS
jgi:hypothetical protein